MDTPHRALQCGGDQLSDVPPLVAAVGPSNCVLLLAASPARSAAIVALAREVLVREKANAWYSRLLFGVWFWLIGGMISLANLYWTQLTDWIREDTVPEKSWSERVMDVLTHMPFVKLVMCLALAILPIILLSRDRHRPNLAHLMIWIGGHRWDHTEMGSAGFYLDRPYLASSHDLQDLQGHRSTGCILGSPKPRLRLTRSTSDCRRPF